jgi:hypothetical protein
MWQLVTLAISLSYIENIKRKFHFRNGSNLVALLAGKK